MFLLILTLAVCLTKAFVFEDPEETSPADPSAVEPLYNIHEWVMTLQLERCAFVAIGLKYFAIFVEDEMSGGGRPRSRRNFFLGVCHQSTLEEWALCSPEMAKRRKHKCRFKLKADDYEARVHRRFCDLSLIAGNKDCHCESTILGDEMVKVKGFPTCYMPPISSSLCKYNVCGLSKCRTSAAEDRVYSVECDPTCRGGYPFCEYPIDRSSRAPISRSFWSKWRQEDTDGESPRMTRRKRFVATCINKYSGRGDVDCLGPGTGCCRNIDNCSCTISQENGVLTVEKIIYVHSPERHKLLPFYHRHRRRHKHRGHFKPHRHQRASDDEDIEDDDDENDDLDEDIALEENTDEEVTITTTEELEKDEMAKELKQDILKEVSHPKNLTDDNKDEVTNGSSGLSRRGFLGILIAAIIHTTIGNSILYIIYF